MTDERGVIFTAHDLTTTATDPDDTELLELHRLPLDEAIQMVLQGKITDSLSVMGLLHLAATR